MMDGYGEFIEYYEPEYFINRDGTAKPMNKYKGNFIKGKKADIALRDLEFSRKRIAKDVSKTVKSAISNAENNYQYDIDNLFIKEAYVGKSLVMKRFRPRAKGRASPIKKPFSRITIVLEEKKEKKGIK